MEEAHDRHGFTPGSAQAAPSLVYLSPFSPIPAPSSRRLSSTFTPRVPVPSARRLARVSLQGRLVNAEEASSAEAIGGGLSREEALAWELFTPLQRFLIVAVIGVAVSESNKNRVISQLQKSVELRDQVLSSMQQKLDSLCQQVTNINNKDSESSPDDAFACESINFVQCGCWHCDQHEALFSGLMDNSGVKGSKGDEVLQYKSPLMNEVDQEERRMSDFSDWSSSVTSSAEVQISSFAIDQDIFNLKRECDAKETTIREMTAILQSTNMASSKRIAELEDIIRRKNTTITKLKKDMVVLEQKVEHLTRLRRRSSFPAISESWQLPPMVDNVVYDMDGTTSPSSSDSDSSPANQPQALVATIQNTSYSSSSSDSESPPIKRQQAPAVEIQETPVWKSDLGSTTNQKLEPLKASISLVRSAQHKAESGSKSPLKEISPNLSSGNLSPLKPKQLSVGSGEFKKIRRRIQTATKVAAPKKRWI